MLEKLNIAQIGEPILRKKTCLVDVNEIKSEKVKKILEKMIFTMRKANGAGIAANQVYESLIIGINILMKFLSKYSSILKLQ